MEELVTIKETFTLPSLGKVYGSKDVNPEITLRSMTTAEDMALTGYTENEYKKICDVIEACIVGDKPKVSVYDMIIGDYTFLLHKLRTVTYGSNYPITIQCPNCQEIVKKDISLDDLIVKEFDASEIGSREITLPVTGKIIKLYFSTPRAKDAIISKAKEYKAKMKTTGINYDMLFETMSYIASIDNERLDEISLQDFVLNLPLKDTKYLLAKGRELDGKVGVDSLLITSCPECGYEFPTRFQYNSEFFNPEMD